ncbi:hypothetical protein O3M35_009367 [Rhynocoris fuscipes]|uniref:Uncharacterized protein n=1 Tax=Rhynocoris fuscipes TaxID=488301 RepID=A0AAW1D436_9HEMI
MCDKKNKNANPLEILSGGGNDKENACDGSSWLGALLGNEGTGEAGKRDEPEGFQEIAHPPISGKHTDRSATYDQKMRNRFLNELYLKYPTLLPKDIPKNRFYEYNVNVKYLGQPTGVTTYRVDYGTMKPEETPDLYTAAGLYKRPPPLKPNREPGLPYLSGKRAPISATEFPSHKEPHVETVLERTTSKQNPKIKSEYGDNINGMAKYFYRKEIYTRPYVFVNTKRTLPKY